MNVTFKSDKNMTGQRGSSIEGGIFDSTMTGMKGSMQASQMKGGDQNAEDYDFANWTLGNGKIKDKQAKLKFYIDKLTD